MGILQFDVLTAKRLRSIYKSMKNRCYNQKAINYKNYGAKGIVICAEWSTISAFREWAIANGYENHLTIERRDGSGNYCPENCCWITQADQNKNRINNRFLIAFGEKKTMQDWARDSRCLVSFGGLRLRLSNGWGHEAAISTPPARKGRPR